MNRQPHQANESWENDAVWKLLDQAPPATPGPRFTDDTVRAARLLGQPQPWWKCLLSPMPLAALAGATAAMVFSFNTLTGPTGPPTGAQGITDATRAAEIQDIAETETLIAATEHLDKFSDNELVTLIGF
jgi:hypothetical protein